MKLSFNFELGKKKSMPMVPNIGTPEYNGTDIFYPLVFDNSHSQALISMYQDLPEVQAPINYIIDKMAIVMEGVTLIERDRQGNEKEIENQEIFSVINKPNQYMNKSDFVKSFFLNRIVLGAGYINRVNAVGFKIPAQLFILPTHTTKPDLNIISRIDPRINEINGYTTDFGHGKIQLSKEEVLVQYEANLCNELDKVQSRLLAAISASQSLRYNYEARVKIYRDRGSLGVLSPKDSMVSLTKEQGDLMRQQYYTDNGITGNKAPFMITSRALEYTPIGFDVAQLKLNENKLQDFQTICALLNVDPALFENSAGAFNNKVLAKRNFWEDVGIPNFNAFLQLLNVVFSLPDNQYFKADYSDIPALQEDYKDKVLANSKAYNDGAITQAEYREAVGYQGGEEKYRYEIEPGRNSQSIQVQSE
jgi:hypothetical protein